MPILAIFSQPLREFPTKFKPLGTVQRCTFENRRDKNKIDSLGFGSGRTAAVVSKTIREHNI
jgi:hypothetical protein